VDFFNCEVRGEGTKFARSVSCWP